MTTLKAWFQLIRPANVVTSIADVLAGIAISGYYLQRSFPTDYMPLVWLCLATATLYGGGVVFNDFFDAELDRVERPERPIPSGAVKKSTAGWMGTILLLVGIASAFAVHRVAGALALAIALCALLYDAWGKHQRVWGPFNMGLCRGLNLMLGMSIVASLPAEKWYYALIPVVYVAAITLVSRGEVSGGKPITLWAAGLCYLAVLVSISYLAFAHAEWHWFPALLILAFAWMIFRPLAAAIRQPSGQRIGMAVKSGVLGIILMDAAWAASFNLPWLGLTILLLLPLSLILARIFAVT